MRLTLEGVGKTVDGMAHIHPVTLALRPDTLTVLLGATQAGKTTLMRLMGGLDRPDTGRVLVDDRDVTGVPVRRRDIAMVYQQFINYPSMSVFDNIASPLRLRRESGLDARVREIAATLRIDHLLDRLPQALSGGQQQRVALARALAKKAPLMLLDEPLVNLDYKLREELRAELSALFARGESTVVYATTEPGEALLMGGWTAVMDAGRVLQYGPTEDVFHAPASLDVARAFSDPPINLVEARSTGAGVRLRDGTVLPLPAPEGEAMTLGIRAHHLRLRPAPGDIALRGTVALAEISGSDTYVHAESPLGPLVAQLTGVHRLELGEPVSIHLSPRDAYLFGGDGRLRHAPGGRAATGVH